MALVTLLAISTLALAPSPAAPAPVLKRVANSLAHVPDGVRSLVLVNDAIRGRDQRSLLVRALAAVHPRVRSAVLLACCAVMCALWLVPGTRADHCIPVQIALRSVCRAAIAIGVLAAVVIASVVTLVVASWRGAREEVKDTALTEQLLAAAAAAAAYESSPEERLRELSVRGVGSANWHVDDELSNEETGVFINPHEQAVIIAYRGTMTLADWGSNLRRILPGDLENSSAFRQGLATARAARDKYLLYKTFLLTGHSRGGAMADFVGRKLGLPAATFNPATWGKVLRGHEEPAARSVTAKTAADLVSVLEAFFPGDRRVVFHAPKNWRTLLVLPSVSALCFLLAWVLLALAARASPLVMPVALGGIHKLLAEPDHARHVAAWLHRGGAACAGLSVAMLTLGSHPVTHFTMH